MEEINNNFFIKISISCHAFCFLKTIFKISKCNKTQIISWKFLYRTVYNLISLCNCFRAYSGQTGIQNNNGNNYYTCVIYIRKKYWNRENFWLLVFNGFTRFRMSWTRFHYFYKMSVCVWQKICGRSSSKTNERNYVKFYF